MFYWNHYWYYDKIKEKKGNINANNSKKKVSFNETIIVHTVYSKDEYSRSIVPYLITGSFNKCYNAEYQILVFIDKYSDHKILMDPISPIHIIQKNIEWCIDESPIYILSKFKTSEVYRIQFIKIFNFFVTVQLLLNETSIVEYNIGHITIKIKYVKRLV